MGISLIWSGLGIGDLAVLFIGWKIGSFILKILSLVMIVGLLMVLGLFGFAGM